MLKIRDGVKRFQETVFPEHREQFTKLAAGQAPEIMFIACADSRVDPALLTQTLPGELFVLRNAGNFVSTQPGSGVAATVEYAVKVLGVQHIVVCGHSHCGAVAAALDPKSAAELPAVASWLANAGPDLTGLTVADDDDRMLEAVKFNALAQIEQLRSLPSVSEAVSAGRLALHAWVYRFETGEVLEHDPARGVFVSISASGASEAVR